MNRLWLYWPRDASFYWTEFPLLEAWTSHLKVANGIRFFLNSWLPLVKSPLICDLVSPFSYRNQCFPHAITVKFNEKKILSSGFLLAVIGLTNGYWCVKVISFDQTGYCIWWNAVFALKFPDFLQNIAWDALYSLNLL